MFAVAVLVSSAAFAGADPAPSPPDALRSLNPLVGSWRATGYPDGTREERQAGFWKEGIAVAWKFQPADAHLVAEFDKGQQFSRWELRYLPVKQHYFLTAYPPPPARNPTVFTGVLTAGKQGEQVLTLDQTDPAPSVAGRLVVTVLHHNRFLYRYETKPAGAGTGFTRKYQVGATKEGEAFANVAKGPECVVTGGVGTSTVTYMGKTYYVCCSGCREAFKDDPAKFVKEFEARQKK